MWFPLINYTHYSLGRAYSKPDALVAKCKANGYTACGLCDYKTISGAVAFFQECKAAGIKPIIGCSLGEIALFAKNKDGWHDLIELVSYIDPDGNIDPANVSLITSRNNLISVRPEYFNPSYYVNQEDADLHRVVLCSASKTTIPKMQKLMVQSSPCPEEYKDILEFFIKDCFYVLNKEESSHLKVEANALNKINEQCEEYNILSRPILPKFDCPNGMSEEEYLKELCRIGWKKLLIDEGVITSEEVKKVYLERFKTEFEVIKGADLFGYFLIVQDILRYVRENGWMAGIGRGSAAGCLISYLTGITGIDPVPYDLLFERFYSAGRNTKDRVSLPDIDIDIPSGKREQIIQYLKDKYGHKRVSQMITFGRLRGKSAIKEIFRVYEACSFAEINAITKYIPDESRISDKLAEMDEDEKSIIRWALLNNAKELHDFCYLDEDGNPQGTHAELFDIAMKIEGTFKSQGKHAAGIVISATDLNKVCPMVNAKDSAEKVAGLEMSDLEALGQVKLDLLGLTLLDKCMYIEERINSKRK